MPIRKMKEWPRRRRSNGSSLEEVSMLRSALAAIVSLAASLALAQTDPHAGHGGHLSPTTAAPAAALSPALASVPRDETLPPAGGHEPSVVGRVSGRGTRHAAGPPPQTPAPTPDSR